MVTENKVVTKVETVGTDRAGAEFIKLSNSIRKIGKKVTTTNKNMKDSYGRVSKTITTVNKSFKQIRTKGEKVARQQFLLNRLTSGYAQRLIDSVEVTDVFNRKLSKTRKVLNAAATNTERFKFELLGTLFFGMAVQRMFTGLLKPAFEMSGVFQLISDTLAILFLPVALAMIPIILKISNFILNLGDKTKFIIGVIVLFGAALGFLLFAFSTIALGVISLGLVFGGLIATVSRLFGGRALGGVASALLILIPGMKGLNSVSKTLLKVWNVLAEFVKPVWDKIKDKVKETIKIIKDELEEQGIDVDTFSQKIKDALGLGDDGVQGIWGAMKKKWDDEIKPMWDKFQDALDDVIKIAPSVQKNLNTITEALELLADAITKVKEAWDEVKDAKIFKLFKGEPTNAGTTPITGLENIRDFVLGRRHILSGEPGSNAVTTNQSITASPTINITTTGGIDDDTISRIKSELGEVISRDLARISRR